MTEDERRVLEEAFSKGAGRKLRLEPIGSDVVEVDAEGFESMVKLLQSNATALAEMTTQRELLRAEHNMLHEEVNIASNARASAEEQLAELTAQRDEYRARIDGTRTFNQGLMDKLSEMTAQRDELIKERNAARTAIDRMNGLKEKLAAAQLEICELRRVLRNLYEELGPVSEEVEYVLDGTVADALLAALKLAHEALKWFHDPRENPIERFDRIADWFHKETGFTRPGRSTPAALGAQDHDAAELAFDKWVKKKCIETCEAIAALELWVTK